MKRREFLGGGAALAGACALAAPEDKTADGGFASVSWADRVRRDVPVLPAGAHAADRFAVKCVGCGLCATACPSKVLRPSDHPKRLGRVELDFRYGWCRPACHACADVCPADAIAPVDLDRRRFVHVGFALIDRNLCLRLAEGVECHACEKHCPVRAIRLLGEAGTDGRVRSPAKVPVVNRDACIGCGACEHYCPVRPRTAIRVEGYAVHRAFAPMGEADLLAEMRAILADGKAFVVARRGVITGAGTGRGVKPLLDLLDADPNALKGATVLDRVTGRASAAICIVGGAAKVVAPTMVEGAKALLEKNGVVAEAGKTVPFLKDRAGTGTCPMDAATASLDDPKAIVEKLRSMR